MGTSTSTTGEISTSTPTDSPVWPGLRAGEQVVAVQIAVWGPQEVTVRAHSDGGREERRTSQSVSCRVLQDLRLRRGSHRLARDRLAGGRAGQPQRATAGVHARNCHAAEDLSVLCTVSAEQRHSFASSTGADGRPVITLGGPRSGSTAVASPS